MDSLEIAQRRVSSLRLSTAPLSSAAEVLRWLVAVQSQDFPGGKWSIAQRTPSLTSAGLDRLFDSGAFLRTHVLRPTWHFVLPDDIRWLQELTGPRVLARMRLYFERAGLDADVLAHSESVLVRALGGGRHLTRPEVQAALAQAGIHVQREALAYVVSSAELRAVICSGALRGTVHTYALVEERVPTARSLTHEEALAELTRRYFTSHGPATTKDFAWWASLTAGEIKRGLELVGSALEHEVVDGVTYWFDPSTFEPPPSPLVRLLQGYDEYFVGHSAATKHLLDISRAMQAWLRDHRVAFNHGVVRDTQVIGSWKRSLAKTGVQVELNVLERLDPRALQSLEQQVERYGQFMESVARASIQCPDE